MNIGDVSERSGLPAKPVRYFEAIGLVQLSRSENGYRDFGPQDLHKLAFLGRARSLSFSVEDCRTLLSLYEDRQRSNSDVKAVAQTHLARIDQKLVELQALSATLRDLVVRCHDDDRPECPIMADLAHSSTA